MSPRNAGNIVVARHSRWLLPLLLAALAGCSSILGLDDGKLVTDAGSDAAVVGPSAKECSDYCGLVEEGCSSTGPLASYRLEGYCSALCPHFVRTGDPQLEEGNNFECRLDQARLAKQVVDAPGEGTENCQRAGPGGAGKCGSNCESYCQLYASVCADFSPDEDCLELCPNLRVDAKANAATAFADSQDTIQCRLAHLAAAALDPGTHCPHATLNPATDTPCNPLAPSCLDYCSIVTNACNTDDSRQYDSLAECVRVCDKGMTKSLPLDPDSKGDTVRDTVACRKYHAYNALVSGPDHCNHAGPGADGHCGKVCPAYCSLVSSACANNGFAAAFGDANGCLANCGALVGTLTIDEQLDYKYNVNKGKAGGNNISCRFYNVVKAFNDPAGSCPSALGNGVCKP